MSTYNTRLQGINTSQLFTDYDLSKIFIWNNRYEVDSFVNNTTYGVLNIPAGTVMGRITATGVLVPATATAVDGSAIPVGIMVESVSVAIGATVSVAICISGDVASEQIGFLYGDTLATIVSGRRYSDRLLADTGGLILRSVTNMTQGDN